MPNQIFYTTEEIAKMLKISKLTVYDIIKRGELPAFRVGKQMRIDAHDFEAYKQRSRMVPEPLTAGTPATTLSARMAPVGIAPRTSTSAKQPVRQIVITGQDTSLDILARQVE